MISAKHMWNRICDLRLFFCFCIFSQLLSVCPYTFVLYQKLLLVSLGWGLPVLAHVFFVERSIYKNCYFPLLFLFCVSYGVTILLNRQQNFIENCGQTVFTCFYFFLFFCAYAQKKEEERRTIMRSVLRIIVVFSLVICTVSLGMLVVQYRGEFFARGTVVPIGLNDRRDSVQLSGIGTSSSILGGLCSTALIAALALDAINAHRHKRWTIASVIIFVLTLCAANAFTQLLFTIGFVCFYLLFSGVIRLPETADNKRILLFAATFAKAVAGTCLVIVLFFGIQKAEAFAVNQIDLLSNQLSVVHHEIQIDRTISTSTTGVRTQIWLEGLKLLAQHPLGVTNANIEVRVFYGVPDYPYYNLHNGFMTLLVASGIVGFLIIMVFGVLLLMQSVRYLASTATVDNRRLVALMMAGVVGLLSENLVNGCFVLWRGAENVLLWLLLGEIYAMTAPILSLRKGWLLTWTRQKSLKNS